MTGSDFEWDGGSRWQVSEEMGLKEGDDGFRGVREPLYLNKSILNTIQFKDNRVSILTVEGKVLKLKHRGSSLNFAPELWGVWCLYPTHNAYGTKVWLNNLRVVINIRHWTNYFLI